VIALVLGMLAARRGQAITLVLLSLVATAAAAAGPVYLKAVDRTIVANQLAAATIGEQTLTIGDTVERFQQSQIASAEFEDLAPPALTLPGFALVYSGEYHVMNVAHPNSADRLVFRDGACEHLVVVAGRCLMADDEIVVVERIAERTEVAPGDVATMKFAVYNALALRWEPAGDPVRLTVVGVVRPRDAGEPFWGVHAYFPPGYQDGLGDVAFTTRQTLERMYHEEQSVSVDAYALPGTITAGRIGAVRTDVDGAIKRYANLENQDTIPATDIPDLLDRIEADQRLAGQLVPLAALPVVLLCWLVIFTAVAYGGQASSTEIGLLALRGLRLPTRWWLTTGEIVVAVLVGAPLGYLAGHALVPGAGDVDAGALPYALVAVAGALFAGFAAQRAQLAAPIVDLLRRTVGKTSTRRVVVAEAATVVLAAATAVELRLGGGLLTGSALVVPALMVLATALLAARVVRPVAARLGGFALRRGRVGLALSAWQVARRPGAQRLAVILVMAVGVLGFAAAATDVAAAARSSRAEAEAGARRVLSVQAASRTTLLRGVRAADPVGEWAMAATQIPGGAPNEPPRLAVDAARFAAVAVWKPAYGGLPVTELGPLLHPPAGEPLILRGTGVAIDATLVARPTGQVRLAVYVAPIDGRSLRTRVQLDPPVHDGAGTYSASTQGCAAGCRLVSIEVGGFAARSGARLRLHEVRQLGPDTVVTPDRWQGGKDVRITPGNDGLGIELTSPQSGAYQVYPADGPYPLPVASSRPLIGDAVTGFDRQPVPAVRAAELAVVPGLGRDGVLVDLEYADRVALDTGSVSGAQVWLSPTAPADAAERLAAQGLGVIGEHSPATLAAGFAAQSPAHALRFAILAAGLAVVLGASGLVLVATVDRRTGDNDLRALRAQGLRRRPARRAVRWSYLLVVLLAAVAGPLAAAAAWLVVGDYIPIFTDGGGAAVRPGWPRPAAVVWPWLAAVAILTATAIVVTRGRRLR